jgi:hypothetical protein
MNGDDCRCRSALSRDGGMSELQVSTGAPPSRASALLRGDENPDRLSEASGIFADPSWQPSKKLTPTICPVFASLIKKRTNIRLNSVMS